MNISSILNGISIGKDTSGNFKLTPEGLAVRTTADGKFFVVKKGRLLDVSELTFDGGENYIYRLPVHGKEIKSGDLVITSENPFSVLFVNSVESDGSLKGIDPGSYEKKESLQPTNILVDAVFRDSSSSQSGALLYVKVVSLIALPSLDDGTETLLPLLLLGNAGNNNPNPDDGLTALLIAQALAGKAGDNKLLPLLLAKGGTSGSLDNLLLIQALSGGGPLSKLFGQSAKDPGPKTRVRKTRKPRTAKSKTLNP